jgi:dihydroorotate dehydrogenase
MYPFFRWLLFHLEPERAHALTLELVRLVAKFLPLRSIVRSVLATPEKPVQVFGLEFPNPVGLAAGYDKNGLGWRGLALLGFGHIEVGTVTLLPQAGNPRPRLFRLSAERALINRLGFPGKGAGFVARQVQDRQPGKLVLGINLGKGKDTPLRDAARDYLALMEIFAPLADYLAINVSSPNTLGLRQLQAKHTLEALLFEMVNKRAHLHSLLTPETKPGDRHNLSPSSGRGAAEFTDGVAGRKGITPPLLVKLSPDLSDTELDDALEVMLSTGVDGVIATNTTTQRESIARSPLAHEIGGLSGVPLRELSTQMVRKIAVRTNGRLPIIGVGGVSDVASARQKLDAGASLVQIYTGLVYQGPGLVKNIISSL